MAKSAATPKSLKATKKIKPKVTRSEQYLINLKYMGDEPTFKPGIQVNDTDYSSALTWYNYMCNKSDARSYLETFLKASGRIDELQKIKALPDNRLNEHACWIARMLSRGIKLTQRSVDHMNAKIKAMILLTDKRDDETEAKTPAPVKDEKVISIQDRVREKASNFIGMFDEEIDQVGWNIDTYEWLTKREVPPMIASKFIDHFKPISDEANQLLDKNCDPQLREGYNHLTRDQIKQRATFYSSLISDIERYVGNTKKQKAQRKPKPVTADKKLKNFKYLKESKELKLTSISPEKILGSQGLLAYNTRYNTLTVFQAIDRGGLDVAGTTIKKYDESTTATYRVGSRKAESVLSLALTGGKKNFAKALNECKKLDNVQNRINENTILLKVN